ncbi:MAG TPA: hypothetical protein VGH32_02760, partial [Pirellulales bacterium]
WRGSDMHCTLRRCRTSSDAEFRREEHLEVGKTPEPIMPKLDCRNIENDPASCGGQPDVIGTRIRVGTTLTILKPQQN